MSDTKDLGFDTLCIHGGHIAENNRAHLTPIYASSTYTFDSAEQAIAIFKGEEPGYIYGRFGNPTINEAEDKIALMEAYDIQDNNGNPLKLAAILHASGMAALTTLLLSNVKAGEKIITHQSLYGGTQEMIDKILPGLGIQSIIVDFHDISKVEEQLQEKVSCFHLIARAVIKKMKNLLVLHSCRFHRSIVKIQMQLLT